jgi:hypothetical protein
VPRLILLAAVLAAVYLLLRRVQSMPPHQRRAEYFKLALGIALVLTLFLALTGRMNWLGAAFAGLLVVARQLGPLLLRLFPILSKRYSKGGSAAGQSSKVETALLRMHLDHDSGDLQGEVLRGEFQGWRLVDMDRLQLERFLAYCRSEDTDSVQLLDSYLQQRFGSEAPFGTQQQAGSANGHTMERSEALAVLGLQDGATEAEIIAAHRKLIQKLHPDRGGNDYLAAQVNRAKDQLLG